MLATTSDSTSEEQEIYEVDRCARALKGCMRHLEVGGCGGHLLTGNLVPERRDPADTIIRKLVLPLQGS
jgi:hypothetical protein